ncbi:hypothetical protein FS749_016290 [Ceratobasidium sp. UAMH 11750]|nr:hypothetical protein FS749_016290 [Ceratobasidium sp. UAMH 11750]
MASRQSRSRDAQIATLNATATDLARVAEQSSVKRPHLAGINCPPEKYLDEDRMFRCEDYDTTDRAHQHLKPKKGTEHYFWRVVNAWSLVDNQNNMVIPQFAKRDDTRDQQVCWLYGFTSPLSDGARRGSRYLSGRTPLYKTVTHENVWQMQTKIMKVRVKTPYMGHLEFYGCKIPCVIFPSFLNNNIFYGVQNVDRNYVPHWNAAIARWAVQHALGNELALRPWQDVKLDGPRPWYFNNWAMRVLRLEHGIPPTHPQDPPRRAMLGACRRPDPGVRARAPTTEDEWLVIPESECDSGDDEEGETDAESINDDVARGLPTSADWNPETKKSTSPRGNVPHPHPEVVAQELERNRRYEQELAARGRGRSQGQGQGSSGGGRVARGAASGAAAGAARGGRQAAQATRAAKSRGDPPGSSNPGAGPTSIPAQNPPRQRRQARRDEPGREAGPSVAAGHEGMDIDVAPEVTPQGHTQDLGSPEAQRAATPSQHGSEVDAVGEPDHDVAMAVVHPPVAPPPIPPAAAAVAPQLVVGPYTSIPDFSSPAPPSQPLVRYSSQGPSGPSSASSPPTTEPALAPGNGLASAVSPPAGQLREAPSSLGLRLHPAPGPPSITFATPLAPGSSSATSGPAPPPAFFVPPPGAPTVRAGRGSQVREQSRALTEDLD